eukprot:snap_masked-scaffold_11-processed-gene-5.39-mRNA-1 protein AED:1.00 eAED:1.00 QI:0/-1/0/0/-1/1/1/0/77
MNQVVKALYREQCDRNFEKKLEYNWHRGSWFFDGTKSGQEKTQNSSYTPEKKLVEQLREAVPNIHLDQVKIDGVISV